MPEQTTIEPGAPEGPTDLKRRSWWSVLKRMAAELLGDRITDWAAALTYYSVLSIFPALLVLTALLGLLGPEPTRSLIDTVKQIGPGSGTDLLVSAITELQDAKPLAGPLALIGVLVALWTASGYIGAFIRAANDIYEVREGRPLWKLLPMRFGLTVLLMLLLAAVLVGVVLTGALADRVGEWLGMGETAVRVWGFVKWPTLALLVSLAFALLYWAAPNARQPGFRWLSPGSVLAVLVWLAASAGFTVYATNFGSYNKTYGSLAGVVVFLVWLWLTNIAVLLGAAFDAELARARGIERGLPPDHEPFLPHRDPPGDEDDPPAENPDGATTPALGRNR
ncbi:YihY/virulence factor BrkB family protein [Nocardia huaxiensis]|uniref:YihY/virulence factor BrkB family protein n=1 Tax=Nocardia huaxiensis TaxID=2755382 RepID=UPI001E480E26|nr:YihY/virulence factor BrkB family protein [Nocardia huaxiensis]UFS99650.1 YihY/virulence factor BrkB family protein [Nocardia huaxiensis]